MVITIVPNIDRVGSCATQIADTVLISESDCGGVVLTPSQNPIGHTEYTSSMYVYKIYRSHLLRV